MPHLHRNSIWQVELPDEWKVKPLRHDGAVIFKPDGIGQIRVIVHPIEQRSVEAGFDRVSHEKFSGKLNGFMWQSLSGDSFRRTWRLIDDRRSLLVTYSCAAQNQGIEKQEVDHILSLLEVVG